MLENLKNRYKDLKSVIEGSHFSLLNAYPSNKAMIAETHSVDENRNIWCRSEESFSEWVSRCFPVTLKFIDRVKGNYIRISGTAFVEAPAAADDQYQKDCTQQSILRIEMQQVVWYYKKTGKIRYFSC